MKKENKKKFKLANSVLGGGDIKTSNAFTLIELLAIIVILAIIAVITVPIILNVIDNAKKGAIKDSAYGYKDAINKYYVSELYENLDFKLSGTYTITDKGRLSNETGVYEIPFTGTQPTGGNLIYENNILTSGCIAMEEYKVNIEDGEITTVEKGSCGSLSDFGPKYIPNENLEEYPNLIGTAYLDPSNIQNTCNEQIESKNRNSLGYKSGINSGCMKWYVYSYNDDGTVNMILDHDTSVKYGDSDGNLYGGPFKGIVYQLYEDTKEWDGVQAMSSSDNYAITWTYSGSEHTYMIDYTGHYNQINSGGSISYEFVQNEPYKSRFISLEEIQQITQKNSGYFDGENVDFQKNIGKGNSTYAWLFDNLNDCEQYGCYTSDNTNTFNSQNFYGYWTSTPFLSATNIGNFVFSTGNFGGGGRNSNYGIRPVIKVSKTVLGIQ